MFKYKICASLALCAALAACGDDLGEQALLGGVAGLGTAAVLDGDLVTGAATGVAANVLLCQTRTARCR